MGVAGEVYGYLYKGGARSMKKIFAALGIALLASVLSISASAETSEEAKIAANTKEADAIVESYHATMKELEKDEPLSSAEAKQVIKEAFKAEGWTVIDEADISVRTADIDPKIIELAYMDIEKADSELKEKILDARKTVVYNFSWTNDVTESGNVFYCVNPATREVTLNPLFSELFPGWDPPTLPVEETETAPRGEQDPELADMSMQGTALSPAEKVAGGVGAVFDKLDVRAYVEPYLPV